MRDVPAGYVTGAEFAQEYRGVYFFHAAVVACHVRYWLTSALGPMGGARVGHQRLRLRPRGARTSRRTNLNSQLGPPRIPLNRGGRI